MYQILGSWNKNLFNLHMGLWNTVECCSLGFLGADAEMEFILQGVF